MNEAYCEVSSTLIKEINRVHIHGPLPIDSIATSSGIIEWVKVCKLLNYRKTVYSKHRAYVVHAALDEHFSEQSSSCNEINKATIKLS